MCRHLLVDGNGAWVRAGPVPESSASKRDLFSLNQAAVLWVSVFATISSAKESNIFPVLCRLVSPPICGISDKRSEAIKAKLKYVSNMYYQTASITVFTMNVPCSSLGMDMTKHKDFLHFGERRLFEAVFEVPFCRIWVWRVSRFVNSNFLLFLKKITDVRLMSSYYLELILDTNVVGNATVFPRFVKRSMKRTRKIRKIILSCFDAFYSKFRLPMPLVAGTRAKLLSLALP